ncbi:MAG: hypothetical protein JSW62_02330 [Thermoplasmatales archaeon]|nr:MAG: hypothetical protein JSW62_02330 [Thermoplasmatales archaeon]
MKNRKIIKRNDAVAGVIEALLLVALVAIVLSTIQLVYIPQIMEQREADHMDEVANQFSFLKSIIDLQSTTQKDVPISSPITLGSMEIPYFVTARAYGQLEIIEEDDYEINVDYGAKIFPLTSIKYIAYNSYFIDQIYAIEGGAIILKQSDGENVRVEPIITIENLTDDVNIYYEIPIITGISGKNFTTGYRDCFVRTNYSSSDSDWITITDVSSIDISTEYLVSWDDLMEELLEENVNINMDSDSVEVTKKTKQINLYYKEIYIYAQISPGWIE